MYHKKKKLLLKLLIPIVCLVTLSPLLIRAEDSQSTGELKISILSDPHLYSTSLGTTGTIFEEYLKKDCKLIKESELILDAALAKIKADDANIVLIPGDLTKDGEKINHEIMAQKLRALEATGKKVYVINGNHDITNPKAYQYSEAGTTRVPNISSDGFESIYREFGYDEAISRDENSLSYVVEPVPGYRIIAIDSCIYNDDTYTSTSKTAGEIKSSTLQWVLAQIKDAKLQGKEIIAMMHHGLVPHTSLQATYYPDFLIKNYSKIATNLADAGLSVVFTGHFHAQDISAFTSLTGNKIYDVETGSLVTYPVPIRKVSLKDRVLSIHSEQVGEIPKFDLKGAEQFDSFGLQYVQSGLDIQVKKLIANVLVKQGVDSITANINAENIGNSYVPVTNAIQPSTYTVSAFLSNCMVNHYRGDESADALTSEIINMYSVSADPTYQVIASIANSFTLDSGGDLTSPVADNNVSVILNPLIVPTPTPTPTPVPTPTVTPAPASSVADSTTILKKVKVSPSKNTVYYGGTTGKTKKIKITVPKGTKYTVKYKSSKTSVATVSKSGTITAKKKGSAVITTTIKINGKSKSFKTKVTVKKAYIKIDKKKTTMKLKSKYTFTVKSYGYSGATSWVTTKKNIVDISKKTGKAVAKSRGTDYIVVKVGKIKKMIKVTVK